MFFLKLKDCGEHCASNADRLTRCGQLDVDRLRCSTLPTVAIASAHRNKGTAASWGIGEPNGLTCCWMKEIASGLAILPTRPKGGGGNLGILAAGQFFQFRHGSNVFPGSDGVDRADQRVALERCSSRLAMRQSILHLESIPGRTEPFARSSDRPATAPEGGLRLGNRPAGVGDKCTVLRRALCLWPLRGRPVAAQADRLAGAAMARITSRSIASNAAMSLPHSYFGNAFQASSMGISAARESDGSVAVETTLNNTSEKPIILNIRVPRRFQFHGVK